MDKQKFLDEVERLLKQLTDERSEDEPGLLRLERISASIALLNHFKTNTNSGKFDLPVLREKEE